MTVPPFPPPAKPDIDMIGRMGATSLDIGYDGPADAPVADVTFYAEAAFGVRKVRASGDHPAEAVAALARQLIDGGTCVHCHRRVRVDPEDVGDTEVCYWARVDIAWLRGCEIEHPSDGPMPTARRLSLELLRAGAPQAMYEAALHGYYDEWSGPLAFPIMQLVTLMALLPSPPPGPNPPKAKQRSKNSRGSTRDHRKTDNNDASRNEGNGANEGSSPGDSRGA